MRRLARDAIRCESWLQPTVGLLEWRCTAHCARHSVAASSLPRGTLSEQPLTKPATFCSAPVPAALATVAVQQQGEQQMKKQKKAIGSPKRPVRSLDQGVLTETRGGEGDGVPATGDPYIGHQHNETLVRSVRTSRGAGLRTRRTRRG
jgi:hypothetical protein